MNSPKLATVFAPILWLGIWLLPFYGFQLSIIPAFATYFLIVLAMIIIAGVPLYLLLKWLNRLTLLYFVIGSFFASFLVIFLFFSISYSMSYTFYIGEVLIVSENIITVEGWKRIIIRCFKGGPWFSGLAFVWWLMAFDVRGLLKQVKVNS